MTTDFIKTEQFLIGTLEDTFERIISSSGYHLKVKYTPTHYVTRGGLFEFSIEDFKTRVWVGLNGHRFFFIVYVNLKDVEKAQAVFNFCFGGAKRVGWEFTYEPVDENVMSIWGTLMTDKALRLAMRETGSVSDSFRLTQEGHFWITDIGMMVQSFIRTCERHGIKSPTNMIPAPL